MNEMNQLGDWLYCVRDYNTYGIKCKKELHILHKKQHWVGEYHQEKGKCRCGAEIPGLIKLYRAMIVSGWMKENE